MTEKNCSKCRKTLPISDFTANTLDEHATPIKTPAACRPCLPHHHQPPTAHRRLHRGTLLGEPDRYVPVGPLADFLETRLATAEADAVAARFGIEERVLYRIRYREYTRINMDTVDRMLCNAHLPGMLRELYPELYDFPEDTTLEMAA
jgi:hypothetical protein